MENFSDSEKYILCLLWRVVIFSDGEKYIFVFTVKSSDL